MKILVIQETDWIERGPHQQHHLFERLSARGHDVRIIDFEFLWSDDGDSNRFRSREVVTPDPGIVDDAKITLIRPSIIKYPIVDKASILPTHYTEIKRQMRKFEPDVVVSFGILNAYIGVNIAEKHQVPFVYYLIDHLHTLLPNELLQKIAKQIEQRVARRADYVYSINDGLQEYAIELGADPDNTRVVPGGVDVARYRSGDHSEVELPRDIGEGPILLFMGWLYEFSGLREVATNLAEADSYDDYCLLVVGEGDMYDELERLKRKRLGDQLVLVGRVPFEKIPHYLDYADVCLLPSEHNDIMQDIVPIKMYEYLASGSPVVATQLPGIEKEFNRGNGVVYASGPEEAFETAVDLIESDAYSRHSRRAREFVKRYDWSRLTAMFERHLEMISREQTPPKHSREEPFSIE